MTDNSPSKLTNWENEPKFEDFIDDLSLARKSHDAHLTKLDMYEEYTNISGKAEIKKYKNRSTIQPKLIKKLGEWRIPALAEPFISQENLFSVSPKTWKDKDGALQNQAILNYQFGTIINKNTFMNKLTRILFYQGTVAIRTGWLLEQEEQTKERDVFQYYMCSPEEAEALQSILQTLGELGLDSPIYNEIQDKNIKESLRIYFETNELVTSEFIGTEEYTELVNVIDQPTVEVIDTRNLYIDPTCGDDFSKAQFVIHSFFTSKSELLKDSRYKNIDKIDFEALKDTVNTSDLARLSEAERTKIDNDGKSFKDVARFKLKAHEYWGYYDIHGTGKTVPIVATFIGDTIIRLEENPYPDKKIPFVVIPYIPVIDSVYGEAEAEIIKDNQTIIGAATRGVIDLLAKSANSQTGIAKNFLDPLNKKRFDNGEDYEFNDLSGRHPDNAMMQHTSKEVPASYFNVITMNTNEAEALTGITAFNQGLNSSSLGEVATAVKGVLSATAKRELSIIRRISAGLIEVAKKIIAMNSEFLTDEEVIRITDDEYISISRDALKGDYDLEITIASEEENSLKAQELSFMVQTIGNSVPFEITKQLMIEIALLRKMYPLAHMLKKYTPEPDPLEEAKKELEIAELQAKIEKAKASAMESQYKAMLYQAQSERVSSLTDLDNLNFVKEEAGIKHQESLERITAQAEAQSNMHVVKEAVKHAFNPDNRKADTEVNTTINLDEVNE